MKVRLALAAVLATLMLAPGVAHAQSCSTIACTANTLKSDPVYQDPKAETKITADQAGQLRQAIASAQPPVYIAFLPQAAATANGGADALPGKIGQAMAVPAVVGVVAGHSFRATSGGGLPYASKDIAQAATDSFNANNPGSRGGDVMPMLLDFIARAHAAPQVQVTQPAARPQTAAPASPATTLAPRPKKPNHAGRNFALGLVVLLLLGVLVITVVNMRGAAERAERKRKLKARIDAQAASLFTLENGGDTFNSVARAHLTKGFSHIRDAEGALDNDDLEGAEVLYQSARQEYDAADRRKNEPEPPPPAPITIPVNKAKRPKKGEERIRSAEVDPEGRVVVNNTVYAPQSSRSDAYPHYFPGGYMGGRMVPGGYYGMNFWDYVILDEILDDRREDRIERSERYSDDRVPAGGGGSVGGGDWGSSTPDPPRRDPDPPSTDWGGSIGGGDWGGGGGGGGDWGGGGGGGDVGGGGW